MDWYPPSRNLVQSMNIYPQPYMPGGWPLSPMASRKRDSESTIYSAAKRLCIRAVTVVPRIRLPPLSRFRRARPRRIAPAHPTQDVFANMPIQHPPTAPAMPLAGSTSAINAPTPPATEPLYSPFPDLGGTVRERWGSKPSSTTLDRPQLPAQAASSAEQQMQCELVSPFAPIENWSSLSSDSPSPVLKSPESARRAYLEAVASIHALSLQQGITQKDEEKQTWSQSEKDDQIESPKPTPKSGSHGGENNKRQTRSARKELEEAQAAKSYSIKPLSQDWEQKVAKALQNGHGTYTAAALRKVVPPSTAGGGTDAWLNDDAINGYLQLVTKHGNRNNRPGQIPRFHALSSFFYPNLRDKGYDSVKRWAKRANIHGSNMLQVEKLFIPINPNSSHWTLLVVEPTIKHITHYNSLGSGKHALVYISHVKSYLATEIGKGYGTDDDWTVEYAGKSGQQQNGSDCGVFTVTTAKQLMLGFAPDSYKPADIPIQRRRMVAELINGGLIKNESQ